MPHRAGENSYCKAILSVPRRRDVAAVPSAVVFAALIALVSCAGPASFAAAAENNNSAAAVEARIAQSAKLFASDELEGRGVGTAGIDKAADYIANRFKQLGLKTELFDGQPFEKFSLVVRSELGDAANNSLSFRDGNENASAAALSSMQLKMTDDFTPLAAGGSGKFDAPLLFVGYGVTAKTEKYDDYDGVDAKGKVVVILRHEPHTKNPHSFFNGQKDSQYATISRKLSNAYEHGAVAVIICNDEAELKKNVADATKRWRVDLDELSKSIEELKKLEKKPSRDAVDALRKKIDDLAGQAQKHGQQMAEAHDPVFKFDRFGDGAEGREFPVLFCRRGAIDPIVKAALGKDLDAIEAQINEAATPKSEELGRWRAVGQTELNHIKAEVKNVVAILPGEGPKADETIVIGAHYDHLGYGGRGSLSGSTEKAIHHGADDNGSGAATLLEVAQELATRGKPLPRRIVFIAFTGEELGLLGSARYVREPLIPLDKTVAMLNMDMVGRLADEKLIIYGTDTATEFEPLLEQLNEHYGFKVTQQKGGYGPSDQSSFYAKNIPVLHFFTGTHKDYHRPSDTFEKLNISGMRRVGQMVAETAVRLAEAPERPTYTESKVAHVKLLASGAGLGDRPYFGSIPDFSQDRPGYALMGVTKDGPAERAGIKAGDIIVKLGESKIGNLEDFDSALRKFKSGDKVPVTVKRGEADQTLDVILDPPRE